LCVGVLSGASSGRDRSWKAVLELQSEKEVGLGPRQATFLCFFLRLPGGLSAWSCPGLHRGVHGTAMFFSPATLRPVTPLRSCSLNHNPKKGSSAGHPRFFFVGCFRGGHRTDAGPVSASSFPMSVYWMFAIRWEGIPTARRGLRFVDAGRSWVALPPPLHQRIQNRRPAMNLTRIGQKSLKKLAIVRPRDGEMGP
jgi:hypothetical protein